MPDSRIDIRAIKIDKPWSCHAKKIYFHDRYVGYIRNATGNRVQACSAFPNSYGRYPEGEAMRGHDSSELIAALELIDALTTRADNIIDFNGDRIIKEIEDERTR